MAAKLMLGEPVADLTYRQVKDKARIFQEIVGRKITLATVLIGDDVPSFNYVNLKHKKATELDINYKHYKLGQDCTQKELSKLIKELNLDDEIDGVLIQYPIPKQLNYELAISELDYLKDVDGLSPFNLGRLALGDPVLIACTPLGIKRMLDYYGIETASKHVVIVGRGLTIGRPLSMLLSQKGSYGDACVTLLHSKINDFYKYTKDADILISAAGSPYLITPEHVKANAVVISAGVKYEGKKLLPDVDESVADVASMITPRIGGVGPVTVAMLFENLTRAAQLRKNLDL